MNDPFDRAARIARGELDEEMPTVDELKQWMRRVPITWRPSLLRQAVSINTETFNSKDDFMRHVERLFDVAADPYSMLRRDDSQPRTDGGEADE